MSRLRVRLASIAALVLLFSYLAIANFVPEASHRSSVSASAAVSVRLFEAGGGMR